MKKLLSMLAVATMLLVAVGCEKNDEVIAASNLPREVTTFVQVHFPNIEIMNVIKDYSGHKAYDFEIMLNDGTRIEISKNGQWQDVENYKKGVPASIVPAPIQAYVVENHPDAKIVAIDRERGFEVELNIGVDIHFDKNGNFNRYDY